MSRHPLLVGPVYRPWAAAISLENGSELNHAARGALLCSWRAASSSREIDAAISGFCEWIARMMAASAKAVWSGLMSSAPLVAIPFNFPKPPHDARDRHLLTQRDIGAAITRAPGDRHEKGGAL